MSTLTLKLNGSTFPIIDAYIRKAIDEDPFETHREPRQLLISLLHKNAVVPNVNACLRVDFSQEEMTYLLEYILTDLAVHFQESYVKELHSYVRENFDSIFSTKRQYPALTDTSL